MIPVEPILFLLIASYNNNFRLIYWAFKDFYRKIDTYVIYNNNYYFRQNSMSENHNFIADKAENNFRHTVETSLSRQQGRYGLMSMNV